MNTGFYDVFKGKLEKMKKDLKKELERAKSDRRKEWLRNQIKQAKSLRDTLKKMDEHLGKTENCPHCGGKL